jgi:hypothetical protein
MDKPDAPCDGGRSETLYVYATTLMRGRSPFALGLPRLRPPGPGTGWEVCAVSYVDEVVLVSWRCLSQVVSGRRRNNW